MELKKENIDKMEFLTTDVRFALKEAGNYGLGFMTSGKWEFWMRKSIDGYMSKHRTYTWENIKSMLHGLGREDLKEKMKEELVQSQIDQKKIREKMETEEYQSKVIKLDSDN